MTVLCGDGHYRVVLGVEETGEFYVFDSLGETARVVGHISQRLHALHPGSVIVELTLAPQGDTHSCGVWVVWAVQAFRRFMNSTHSDLQAFLVQDMATQGCTPTPSRGNQARISTLKRAIRAAYIPVAGARTELAIRHQGEGSTRALIRGSGSTTRRSRALPKVAPEGVRGIDTFFAPAPRGGADSRERGGEPVEPALQPAQPVAVDDAAILRRCWKAVPQPLPEETRPVSAH